MKKILALAGSPRTKGHTRYLLDQVLEGAENAGADVETIHVAKKNISGCISCYKCQETDEFKCALEDDMQGILQTIVDADELILATPVYWFGPTAQLKSVIDRLFCLFKFDPTKGYYGPLQGKGLSLVVTAQGDPFSGADQVVQLVQRIGSYCRMAYRGTIGAYQVQDVKQIQGNTLLREEAKDFGVQLGCL
ncbi:MAG: flavodoxin family protein [Desulfatiglans sp.]|jgi:multimeric flavodoxin WrbA|nr:flavodoxin family protein [Thermodesulfobacteriota bacterium]MEE4354546.1 flavodoxin family protein [Desulfatiglans sp.]